MGKRHGNDSARFARVPRSMIHSFQHTIPYGQRGVAGGVRWGRGREGHWPSQGRVLIRVKGQTKPWLWYHSNWFALHINYPDPTHSTPSLPHCPLPFASSLRLYSNKMFIMALIIITDSCLRVFLFLILFFLLKKGVEKVFRLQID